MHGWLMKTASSLLPTLLQLIFVYENGKHICLASYETSQGHEYSNNVVITIGKRRMIDYKLH